MDSRQRRDHPAVALVGDDEARAGLGDQEVAAGDAEVRRHEVLAQHVARLARHLADVGLPRLAVMPREEIGYFVLRLVDRGGDDVRRRLAGELDDVLAEIGLDRLHPVSRERVVQPRLLRKHRLRLDRFREAVAPGDLEDERARLGAGFGEKHRRAAPRRLALEALDVGIQRVERPISDLRAGRPQPLERLRTVSVDDPGAREREAARAELAQVRLEDTVARARRRHGA